MEVLTSASGREALATLQKQEVDIVISDIKMPDLSGVELLREAKALAPETIFGSTLDTGLDVGLDIGNSFATEGTRSIENQLDRFS
jgi:CheY-like chemotaxis protein